MKRIVIVAGLICVLLSLVTLALLPPSVDQAALAAAGRKLLSGAPFRDIFDARPPGVPFLYGVATLFFGAALFDFRIFDVVFHLAALFVFYSYLKHRMQSNVFALAATAVYIVMIVSLGAAHTTQAETFAFLPSFLTFIIADTFVRNGPSSKRAILSGILIGFLFIITVALKYTLIAPTLAALTFILLGKIPVKPKLLFTAGTLICILTCLGVIILVLDGTGLADSAGISLQYALSLTTELPLTFDSIRELSYIGFTTKLFVIITPTVLICAAVGMYHASSLQSSFFQQMFFQLAFGMLTILIERSNANYQFARLFWIISPFAILALREIAPYIVHSWKRIGHVKAALRAGIVTVILFGLFYSPISLFVIDGVRVSYLTATSGIQSRVVQDAMSENIHYNRGSFEFADSLRPKLQPNDALFLFGSNLLPYLLLDKLPPTPLLLSQDLHGDLTPPQWKKTVMDDLRKHLPRFIAVETSDFIDIAGQTVSNSYTAFVSWEELFNFVLDNYNEVGIIGGFEIYERNEIEPMPE